MMGDEKLSSTYLIRQKIEFLLSGSPVLNGGLGAKISPFDFNDTGWIKKSHMVFWPRIKTLINQ